MARTDVVVSSSAVIAGSAVRGPSPSAQVRAVLSLKLAKLSKKALEEKLEEKRVRRESWRSQIEKNKKEREDEKKVKALRIVVNKPSKKPSQVGKVKAAPKEEIAPLVQVTGTDIAYQSRPQFQSRILVPRIYWRAEVAKYEEARRARLLGKVEPKLVKKLEGTKEGGSDLFRKNEEARRVQSERLRAEREKKEKKQEEEREKEHEKKMEHERQLAKEIDASFQSLTEAIREEKKMIVKEIKKSDVKKLKKPCKSVVKNATEALTGTEVAYQPQAEANCVGFEKLWHEIRSDLLKKRELLIEKKRMEEARLRRAHKQVEKGEKVAKEMRGEVLIYNERKNVIVVKKGALDSDSESASPTGVLQKRIGFGWSECSSTDSSSVGSESDDDACTSD